MRSFFFGGVDPGHAWGAVFVVSTSCLQPARWPQRFWACSKEVCGGGGGGSRAMFVPIPPKWKVK